MKIGKLNFDVNSIYHIGASLLICLLVGLGIWYLSDKNMIAGCASGLASSLGCGITREVTDKDCGGIFDWSDIICDLIGNAIAVVILFCISL